MDMGIYAYRGDVHGIGSDACCRLPSDHGELHHLVGVRRHDTIVFVPEDPAAFHYGLSFLFRETGRTDQFCDIIYVRFGYGLDRGVFVEKVVGGLPGVIVLGALGEYGGDEYMERIRRPFRSQPSRTRFTCP